ncbi:MAG: ketoacyl-ACP synthase III, partial [Prevotellaceae bacterium]|nr:ketoacyl-ACP synthase III [Prevotellaceae bacterium]
LGNTGSVSSMLIFAQNYHRFCANDLICLSVFGGGYSAGACLIKF